VLEEGSLSTVWLARSAAVFRFLRKLRFNALQLLSEQIRVPGLRFRA